MARLKSIRLRIARIIFRAVFQNENRVSAIDISWKLHRVLLKNRAILCLLYPRRVCLALRKIGNSPEDSKRLVVSFLRGLARMFKNRIIYDKTSYYDQGKVRSKYVYRLIKCI